jgi:hypothetical protein
MLQIGMQLTDGRQVIFCVHSRKKLGAAMRIELKKSWLLLLTAEPFDLAIDFFKNKSS